jgi:hypothetical protein
VEIVRESVMPTGSSQVEFAVNGRPKVVLRKRDGHATSHSFHLSGPCSSSSTPPIDSYSLNDITADHSSNQRPSSFSASSIYTRALSDDIQRPDSIGFDLATAACDVSAPRKSVSFSRSTYSSVSGSGTPRAPIASTAVPEESLSSSSSSTGSPSSDDVFMSVAGSRECSTSPFERQSKVTRVAPRVVKSPDSTTCVEPTRSSSSTVDRADGSRSVETRSDVFYSAAGSDSDSEPLGGSRQALSNPNHCISDLCSDDESEDVTDHISSNHGVASRRFQSPVCNHSSQSARHIDDTGLGSERCVKLPDERAKQDACTVDLDDSAADGLSSSAAVVHEVDSIKSSVLGDDNIDTANVNTNGAGVASDNSTDVIVSNDNVRTASPLAVVERPADESSRDSMVTKEHVMTGQSVQRDAISENAELVDERQKSSSDGCQGQAAGESDGCGGNDSHCEDWLFIDDTDDDICADVSATRSLRRIAEEARSSPTMTRSSANNTTTSDVSFESPFHSPPTSPTLMDAITDVWLRGIGTRDERKYAQDLMNESFANDTDQSDLTTLESRQQQQQDGMVVDRAGTRVPSLSAGSAGVDENPLSSGMAAASDGTIVAETLNRSNNAVADALQTRQSPVDVMSAPVDASAPPPRLKSRRRPSPVCDARSRRRQMQPSRVTTILYSTRQLNLYPRFRT